MKQFERLYLGPKCENEELFRVEILDVVQHWLDWRKSKYPSDGVAISQDGSDINFDAEAQELLKDNLNKLSVALEGESPKFSTRYIGHMVSEVSLPALLGHMVMLLHNPNNLSAQVSKVGSMIENESIAALSGMLGFNLGSNGHFTSGGTIANIEALWRARFRFDHWLSLGCYLNIRGHSSETLIEHSHQGWEKFNKLKKEYQLAADSHKPYSFVARSPWEVQDCYSKVFKTSFKGPVVLIPKNKHYSWEKGVSLLGLGGSSFWQVDLDENGKLCVEDLKIKIDKAINEQRPILMVVSVAGTTELGEVDPVDKVQDLLESYRKKYGYHIWHHVDAAYGGFFCSLLGSKRSGLSNGVLEALSGIRRVDSVTIDPHKLGYIPYSCGAVIVPDSQNYQVSTFKAPYIDSSDRIEKWTKTIEGSRSATGAGATWMNSKDFKFTPGGFGVVLRETIQNKKRLEKVFSENNKDLQILNGCDTNILCFTLFEERDNLSIHNKRIQFVHDALNNLKGDEIYVTNTRFHINDYYKMFDPDFTKYKIIKDESFVDVLRVVLMNPFLNSAELSFDVLDELSQRVNQLSKLFKD